MPDAGIVGAGTGGLHLALLLEAHFPPIFERAAEATAEFIGAFTPAPAG
jgi:hypothetical protein